MDGLEDLLSIKFHNGICVQTIENEVDTRHCVHLRGDGDPCPERPVFFTYPLYEVFIEAFK